MDFSSSPSAATEAAAPWQLAVAVVPVRSVLAGGGWKEGCSELNGLVVFCVWRLFTNKMLCF